MSAGIEVRYSSCFRQSDMVTSYDYEFTIVSWRKLRESLLRVACDKLAIYMGPQS